MSQFYVQSGGGGGGGNPIDEFITQNGTMTPIGNIGIFNGFDSNINNINGIATRGGVAGTGTQNEMDAILTNRFHGTLTTTDGAVHILAQLPVSITNGVIRVDVKIVGFNSTDSLAGTAEIEGSFKVLAGVNTALPNTYFDSQEDLLFRSHVLVQFYKLFFS